MPSNCRQEVVCVMVKLPLVAGQAVVAP